MKITNSLRIIMFISCVLLNLTSFCQVNSDFDTQIKQYHNFISNPIHLPKLTNDILIDVTKHKDYFNYNFNNKNFYLDSNNIAWAGNWFAWSQGGIAKRWKSTDKLFADKGELNKDFWKKVEAMSKEEIAKLSPVEKYDIYVCGKDYEFFWASNQELIARGPHKLPTIDENGHEVPCNFCGFCNGARVSGALMPEPIKEITVKSKNHPNIEVTFYPADLKALSAASYYYLDSINTLSLGLNYNDKISSSENLKYNPNPAVVDIILRQYLSEYKIPLFIDVQYNNEIWNETILGFDRTVVSSSNVMPGSYSNPKIKKEILMNCILFCQDEVAISEINGKTTHTMSNKASVLSKGWVKEQKYQYKLLVDINGNIIDGMWVGEPIDFIWLGKGEGADSKHTYNSANPSTANYTGNSNIVFSDILELVKLASKK